MELSASYALRLSAGSSLFVCGGLPSGHQHFDAFILEGAVTRGSWTLFARAERTENDELGAAGGDHGPVFAVGKASLGVLHDVRVVPHMRLGIGGLWALNFVPAGLEPAYAGGRDGAMAFLRVTID